MEAPIIGIEKKLARMTDNKDLQLQVHELKAIVQMLVAVVKDIQIKQNR